MRCALDDHHVYIDAWFWPPPHTALWHGFSCRWSMQRFCHCTMPHGSQAHAPTFPRLCTVPDADNTSVGLTADESRAKGGLFSAPATFTSTRHSAAARRIGHKRRGLPRALVQMSLHVDRLTGGGGCGAQLLPAAARRLWSGERGSGSSATGQVQRTTVSKRGQSLFTHCRLSPNSC